MKPIREAWCGLIDITNHCGRQCVYCTRYDRHHNLKTLFNMELNFFEKALLSYANFPSVIGIIGGEPLAHPDLKYICEIIRKHMPKNRMFIFTSVKQQPDYLKDTFGTILYHEHNEIQERTYRHQPSTLAIKDMVTNPELRKELINDCWLQRKWCPTITNDGAYFCENGAALAKFLGYKGWEVTSNWWQREPKDFKEQLNICEFCGMCIPIERQFMKDLKQKISKSFYDILNRQGFHLGDYELITKPITIKEMKAALPGWQPGWYKAEQFAERFNFSTIDWNKWHD